MKVDSARWLPDVARRRDVIRLLCLPYAGSGASVFSAWPGRIPDVEVVPVRLPGREGRLDEPAYDRLDALVDDLADALAPVLDGPYAMFGHSMGALVTFELARRLRRESRPMPLCLFASACRAPQRRVPHAPSGRMVELLRRIKLLGGTPDEVLSNPELLGLVLPTLRADFHLVDTYTYRAEPPLPCPIVALCGKDDPEATPDEAEQWRHQTSAAFDLVQLPGGHFNINEERDLLLAAIGRAFAALTPNTLGKARR
jgi:medium-chain acyl-[acyl-carrier-protein] hydrolase